MKIDQNAPSPEWTQIAEYPSNYPGLDKLNEIQTKYGYLILPNIEDGQARLPLYLNNAYNIYYFGEWLKGERHGKGTQFMPDSSIFQG